MIDWVMKFQKPPCTFFVHPVFRCNGFMTSYAHSPKSEKKFSSNTFTFGTNRWHFSRRSKVSLGPGSRNQLMKSYWGRKSSIWPFDVSFQHNHLMNDVTYTETSENTEKTTPVNFKRPYFGSNNFDLPLVFFIIPDKTSEFSYVLIYLF